MGKHRRLSAFARRTWTFRPLIALGAILLMAFAAIVYAAANDLNHSGGGAVAEAGEPNVAPPVGGASPTSGSTVMIVTPGGPGVTASPSAGPPATTPTRAPATVPPTSAAAPPTSGAVTGAYEVSDSWTDGFIALITLTNAKETAQGWVLNLVYPAGVSGVENSWISGGGDTATLSWSGHSLTMTSNSPLAGGATITVGIQFRKAGSDFTPTTCQVNQRICSF